MGNRAVITTKQNFENNGVGIYLHWNGGYDSVNAFLKYCELKGYRTPDSDCYGFARLCQVIGNYFGGGLSIGIDTIDRLDCDNYDNGTYIIDGWNIVGREYFEGREQDSYDLIEMLVDIDEAQPKREQLGSKFILAPVVKTSNLKIGDKIWVRNCIEDYEIHKVEGIGNGIVNGNDMTGVPYVDLYERDGDYSWNCNNYIRTGTVRLAGKIEEE